VQLVGIGTGSVHAVAAFKRLTAFPGPVYVDASPSLAVFKSLGARMRGDPVSCCTLVRYAVEGAGAAVRNVARQPSLLRGAAGANVDVQGGVLFIEVSPDGGLHVLFQRMFASIEETFPTREIERAVQQLDGRRPSNPEQEQ